MTDGPDPSAKDRAELYLKLAQQAHDRFKSRRDVEWKVSIGLWTLFGAGGISILTARDWPVHDEGMNRAILGVGAAVAIFSALLFGGVWLRYIAEAMRRDQMTGYYWETAVQMVLKHPMPWPLDPREAGAVENAWWISVWHGVPLKTPETKAALHEHLEKHHNSQLCQMFITLAFAAFFCVALAGRCLTAAPSAPRPAAKADDGPPGRLR